jgi:hypothetical protein
VVRPTDRHCRHTCDDGSDSTRSDQGSAQAADPALTRRGTGDHGIDSVAGCSREQPARIVSAGDGSRQRTDAESDIADASGPS